MSESKQSFNWNNLPLVPIILGGTVLYFAPKIMELLGLAKDKGDKTVDTAQYDAVWTPKYYKDLAAKGKIYILTQDSLKNFAKQVYDSKGFFNDDEDKLTGVFKAINYKTQVSQLAEYFFNTYKKDLYGFMNSFLDNDTEFVPIINIVNAKPSGAA